MTATGSRCGHNGVLACGCLLAWGHDSIPLSKRLLHSRGRLLGLRTAARLQRLCSRQLHRSLAAHCRSLCSRLMLLRALLWCPSCFAGLDCRLLPLHWLILQKKVQCQRECLDPLHRSLYQLRLPNALLPVLPLCPTPLQQAQNVQMLDWLDLHIDSRFRVERPEVQPSWNLAGATSQNLSMQLQPMQDEPETYKSWESLQKGVCTCAFQCHD